MKFLANFTKNPNAPDHGGNTPIYWAVFWGHVEVVHVLAPFIDNTPNNFGETPIQVLIRVAEEEGHQNVVDVLTQYVNAE